MKTIKGKMFIIYAMVFIALLITVIGAYIAVDTQRQHLILTELLSKQKLLVERATYSTINAAEAGLVNQDRFIEKLEENQGSIEQNIGSVDFMLDAFTIKSYPIDGKEVALKFKDEFMTIFDQALEESKTEWTTAKASITYLLNPDNLSNLNTYKKELDEFRLINIQLLESSDYLTKICRDEANRKRKQSGYIQTGSIIGAFLIFILMILVMEKDFKKPLKQINTVFNAMGKGQLDLKLDRKQPDEFKELFDNFNHFSESLKTIRNIEFEILKEDRIENVLSYVSNAFKPFASFDSIALHYQDTNEENIIITYKDGDIIEEKTDIISRYNELTYTTTELHLPIHINHAYLGFVTWYAKDGFDDASKEFIKTLSGTLSFAFYKTLLFKDLLAIVTDGLADLAESRDPETRWHLVRMSSYACAIANELRKKDKYQYIDHEYLTTLKLTAPMHDIGKVSVPDSILLKPGKLTDEEFDIMKTHAYEGSVVLRKIHARFTQYNLNYFDMAAEIALCHQEKFNGSGYPNQIAGEDIPLSARISAVADVFDALTSDRPYKKAFSLEKSFDIIKESSGSHFDPEVVEAFFAVEDDIRNIYNQYGEAKH